MFEIMSLNTCSILFVYSASLSVLYYTPHYCSLFLIIIIVLLFNVYEHFVPKE